MSETDSSPGSSSGSSPIRKRVRMRDVAARAGVSVSTVSLVLSGDLRIPEDTTRKVLQTVKAMEYRPNIIARSLARKGSRTIGVILPEQAFVRNQAFYYQALQGIHAHTQPAGYKLVVEAANKIFLERRYYHRLLKEQSADGMIYMAATLQDQFLSEMTKEPTPFVLLGFSVDQIGLPIVSINNQLGAEMGVRHLISLGHKQIGFVGGSLNLSAGRDRQAGFISAMKEAGLSALPDMMVDGEFGSSEAEVAVARLLEKKCSALFVAADTMAYGVLRAARKVGLRVPDDLAIVSMDNLAMAEWMTPALTTVNTHVVELGGHAARFVLRHVKNPQANKANVEGLPQPELIIRESCGAQK